jgi:small subunit ribosomal protein S3
MGQKVNPIGFRLGVNRDWRSKWYASPQEMPAFLHSDLQIRDYVKKKLQFAAVSKIVIERAWNSIRVTIFTARPGIVIGRKGAEIEKMTEEISKMAQGKQIKSSGRLNGAEISRSEWYREGKVPLHTLRTPIDYGFAEANTVYGKIGVKCWICKKEEAPVAEAQPATLPPPPEPVEA